MSVVGLTFGMAAKARRPTTARAAIAATSASTRAGGRSRSYQAKPATRASASTTREDSCQLIVRAPAAGPAGHVLRRGAASARAACSGSSSRPPVMRATWVEKWRPPPSTSAGGPSAMTLPGPSSTTRSANAAANSLSCVATITAAPARASSSMRVTSRSRWAPSIPRVGSSSSTAACSPPPSATSSASR